MKRCTAVHPILFSIALSGGCVAPVEERGATRDDSSLERPETARRADDEADGEASGPVARDAPAIGTTYWVSSSSGADANDGRSAARPWRTMAKVNAMTFAPGDVVRFSGTFVDQPVRDPGSGTSEAPITFVGDGPFDGRARVDRIELTSAEHVVFRSFEASGAKKDLVKIRRAAGDPRVRFVRFEDLYLHDANSGVNVAGPRHTDITFVNTIIAAMWMDGVLLEDAAGDRFSFLGGSIEDTGRRGPVAHWNVHGVYASGGHGHVFDGVAFGRNANGASLSLRRGDVTVRHCRFHGGKMISNNNEDEGGPGSRDLTYRIYRNVFFGPGVGIYQGGNNDAGIDDPGNAWLVFNNTFIDATVDFGTSSPTAQYYDIYLRNNVFAGGRVAMRAPVAGRVHELSHNGWWKAGAPQGSANVVADPLLDASGGVTAAAYQDEGTPALAAGVTMLAGAAGGMGFAGAAPDIGASER